MDFIKNIAASAQGGNHPTTQDGRPAAQSSNVQATSAGVGGGLMGKLNGALGGGQSGEKNEGPS